LAEVEKSDVSVCKSYCFFFGFWNHGNDYAFSSGVAVSWETQKSVRTIAVPIRMFFRHDRTGDFVQGYFIGVTDDFHDDRSYSIFLKSQKKTTPGGGFSRFV